MWAVLCDPYFGTTKHAIYPTSVSILESSVGGESPHIYFVCSITYFRWWILAKPDPYLSIFVIWHGTCMLDHLLVQWTDFWSVYWFELNLSRSQLPVNDVLFLSAVFEKLTSTHTVILTFSTVTGTFRVSTCEMLKIIDFECKIRCVELHLNKLFSKNF